MTQSVLVINTGSSSIKYQLTDPHTGEAFASGLVERIGEDEDGRLLHKTGTTETEVTQPIEDHNEGLRLVLQTFDRVGPALKEAGIIAVGHRVVQGGSHFDGPALIDDRVTGLIEDLCPLGPLHNPGHLMGIRAARELLPDVPHVAVFDTAFFQGLPEAAATYALDKKVAEQYQIRRYGAHGTSHAFVSGQIADHLGSEDLKQVVLHLGNGASASAVVGRRAVDTSMGLTPLEGLVMGTRTGDIDPATVFHLARQANMSIDEIDILFNKKSGLRGLAGSNDMRTVRAAAKAGDSGARLALDVYVHRLRKYIGAYTAVMDGIDTITFTAGVGENDADIRSEVCAGLTYLGVEIDEEANAVRSGELRKISTEASKVDVFVCPTNEELAIARLCLTCIGKIGE